MRTLIISVIISLVLLSKANAQWKKLFMNDTGGSYSCSSELNPPPFNEFGEYGAHNLCDKDFSTAWVEGVEGNGIGESINIGIGNELKDYMFFVNGYQKTETLYYMNNRVKIARISLYVGSHTIEGVWQTGINWDVLQFGEEKIIHFRDTFGIQRFDFPFDQKGVTKFKEQAMESYKKRHEKEIEKPDEYLPVLYILRLEIMEVYKGSKWDDTCISDIWFSSEKKATEIFVNEKITDVYKNDDDGSIYVNTTKRKKIILVNREELEKEENLGEGEHLSLVLMDVSPDKEWAQVDYLYGHEGPGSVEEIAHLYSVRLLTRVDKVLLNNAFGMYGFIEKDGKIYMDTDKGLIDLKAIYYELELLREKK